MYIMTAFTDNLPTSNSSWDQPPCRSVPRARRPYVYMFLIVMQGLRSICMIFQWHAQSAACPYAYLCKNM